MIPNVLTIAGTDPTGGAGIQADLKTFSAVGAYGMAVVTALVAQNTTGVSEVQVLSPEFVRAQIDSVFSDVRVDAVKIGMLADAGIVRAVAAALREYAPEHVVLDPVMVAKSGDRLLAPDAVAALRDELVPIVDLITPNLPEAADLLGEKEIHDEAEMAGVARRLSELGRARVLLKGGHLSGEKSTDLFLEGGETTMLTDVRVPTRNTHGTGCTLSSAAAAFRPRRPDWISAVTDAKAYLSGAIAAADQLDVGHGNGPVHHFYALWEK
jgi:hydroxymethylpyrimidine/phosphomethylpyrimidine kinase